jgi:hypothetical protein
MGPHPASQWPEARDEDRKREYIRKEAAIHGKFLFLAARRLEAFCRSCARFSFALVRGAERPGVSIQDRGVAKAFRILRKEPLPSQTMLMKGGSSYYLFVYDFRIRTKIVRVRCPPEKRRKGSTTAVRTPSPSFRHGVREPAR